MQTETPFASFLSTYRTKRFPKGQILLHQGESTEDVFVLRHGAIKLFNIDEQGNETILHIIETMAAFPIFHHMAEKPLLSWFYAAITDVEVTVMPFKALKEAMTTNPDILREVMIHCAREVHELFVRLDSMGKSTTKAKLIAALKFLVVQHSTEIGGGWHRITFPVSHQLLADMTGITRESITVAIRSLQKEGLVRSPQLSVVEVDFPGLIAFGAPTDSSFAS